ncbi:bifunctional isocitrate dehydrogenase kinase/phosphatase [Litorivicinus lipolyticus]|uniref:bifunctional isocitrate dehydrogenase kinase/phosphatase n=1 Tax=Litorivicinus lipolyticus TaxID=418701 RepID=UPI003B593EC8
MRLFSPRQVAQTIQDGFATYRHRFIQITLGAPDRFDQADWLAVQQAAADRIELYEASVTDVSDTLRARVGPENLNADVWKETRDMYLSMIRERTDPELAETFFNSIFGRIFNQQKRTPELVFTESWFAGHQQGVSSQGIAMVYRLTAGADDAFDQVFDDYAFGIPWAQRSADRARIVRTFESYVSPQLMADTDARLEVLKSVFYRNKGAYLVARFVAGTTQVPLVIALVNDDGEVRVDAVVMDSEQVSIIFSFTRAYFMVDVPMPTEFVDFLQAMMPDKARPELYTSIGFYKHGKTELIRDMNHHLVRTDDAFVEAPGIRGLVMAVFTLPSLPVVFKLIKDRFGPSKMMSRDAVKRTYQLVKVHDRVGRMADTQEFHNLEFPRGRFSPALLEELLSSCANTVELSDDTVLIKHLYTERRMIPLNLWLQDAPKDQWKPVLDDYGWAIKQMAAANIFPGDMLLKNFGVTRHHRVVFYDYDEISYLTEVNFRKVPEPQTPEQEMAAEPWYSVGIHDVFPEEFPTFLFTDPEPRKIFMQLHPEIFDPRWWQDTQKAIEAGQLMDFFPYRGDHQAAFNWSI